MYRRDSWIFRNSIEHEVKYPGKYGAKGEKRQKKKKATTEQIKKQNQRSREKNMRRLIKENFKAGDLWTTLKYPKGFKKPLGDVMKDMRKFLRRLRREWKKRGEPLRYVYRVEIGKRGGIHIHILVNRLPEGDTDRLIQEAWEDGRVNFESIYEYGGFQKLAEYIVKQPEEEMEGQLSLFDETERKLLLKYSTSRNLVRPKPEHKTYLRRTVRRLIEEGPKPEEGFYIDKDSIVWGVNPFTGLTYYHYTEYRITPVRLAPGEKGGDG